MPKNDSLDVRAVNIMKGLIMDTVRKANSGHPGGAMSSTDLCYVLFKDFLKIDPEATDWFDRDRFVLSAGHESALLYSLLALTGNLTLDDLKQFRQRGSLTPGHPENFVTPGVEVSTGPLGQGFSMAVGLAAAEAMLRVRLGEDVCDHFTYVLSSDGDFQAPVCLGSASLAGLWGLGKLIVFYDSNKVQLAGPTSLCDIADHAKIFEGFGWEVLEVDGHDHNAIRKAVKKAQKSTDKPTLIIGHTTMAKGSCTLEGNCCTHGAPFSEEEIKKTKAGLGLPEDETFFLPAEVVDHFRARFPEVAAKRRAWVENLDAKITKDDDFQNLWRQVKRDPGNRTFDWPDFETGSSVATRKAWGAALDALTTQLPLLVGGSADLDPSNQTQKFRDTTGIFGKDNPKGRSLCFGVREFPMAAILNGISLHGGLIPFGATFLIFSDYARNALRMSALQGLPVLYVFTHDSFYVGEDGPTHQPVEQASSLRLIPNMLVLRPADANETCACLEIALKQKDKPSCLLLTRQGLPVLDPADSPAGAEGPSRGGYILREAPGGEPDCILLAAGSEVSLALAAAELLPDMAIRVVSMPCMELFDAQPKAYRDMVLPPDVPFRVATEAGRPELWTKYTGSIDKVLGLSSFGASAPANVLAKEYGFTPENLAALVTSQKS